MFKSQAYSHILRSISAESSTDTIVQPEGFLTSTVKGSHLDITVRLRRWWAFVENWTPTDAQLRRWAHFLNAFNAGFGLWLKIVLIGFMAYFMVEVVTAFLSGGAVDRVIHGVTR